MYHLVLEEGAVTDPPPPPTKQSKGKKQLFSSEMNKKPTMVVECKSSQKREQA